MLMLSEQAIVLDGCAETADLFRDVGGLTVQLIDYHRYFMLLILQVELDRTRVLVLINFDPASLDRLKLLVGLAFEVNHLGVDNELSAGEA